MKKYIFLLVIVICAFVFARFGGEDTTQTASSVLRIGVECDYAPNNWEEKRPTNSNVPLSNQSGAYAEGYDIQVAKIVAAKAGYTLEAKKLAWDNLIPALLKGEIDAIFSGMLDSKERKKMINFSNTYEVNETEYAVLVNTSSPYVSAKKMTDFTGAKFTGQKSTNLYAAISQLPGAIALPAVDTVQEMLDAVTSGKVDASVINLDTGRSYERTYNNLKVIRFPEHEGFVMGFNGICAGVRKNDTELLAKINRALESLTKSERRKIMDETVSRLLNNKL